MMHRDLKSPNVLLSEEGVAKIADVGMVRAQVQELVTAQPVMTPLWAAPEVSTPPACLLSSLHPYQPCSVVVLILLLAMRMLDTIALVFCILQPLHA